MNNSPYDIVMFKTRKNCELVRNLLNSSDDAEILKAKEAIIERNKGELIHIVVESNKDQTTTYTKADISCGSNCPKFK